MSSATRPGDVVGTDDRVAALAQTLRDSPGPLLPRAAGTKDALSTPPAGASPLDVRALNGVIDYDPAELTFTAMAATPVREIVELLAAQRQYLPFDPPWADAGASLGGTVAAGVSGPGSYRHGGVRDFILGVRLLDGSGRLISGGGKVVKNAAGFDLPKLMVGTLGRMGILISMSFKVFPLPAAWTTLRVKTEGLTDSLTIATRLARSSFELETLDLDPPRELWLRLGGRAAVLARRADRLARFVDRPTEQLTGSDDVRRWQEARELTWVGPGSALVRVATTPGKLTALDAALAAAGAQRRYSRGGNAAWLAWPEAHPLTRLDQILKELRLAGTRLRGGDGPPLLGPPQGGAFAARVRAVFDPHDRFVEI